MTRIVFDTGGWIDTEADAIELLNAIGTENAPEYICVATAHGNAIIRTGCIMYAYELTDEMRGIGRKAPDDN